MSEAGCAGLAGLQPILCIEKHRFRSVRPFMFIAVSCAEDTVGRGPVPRYASVVKENGREFWAAAIFRAARTIAGDRPPRDGTSGVFFDGSERRSRRNCCLGAALDPTQ